MSPPPASYSSSHRDLLLHDKRFIQMEAHRLLGAAAALVSWKHDLRATAPGEAPVGRCIQRAAGPVAADLGSHQLGWALWFAALAAANIYIARNFQKAFWVNFKVFGITVAMLIFMIPQVIWLHGKTAAAPAEGGNVTAEAQAVSASATREQRLRDGSEPASPHSNSVIEDESRFHAGHAGAAGGHSQLSRADRGRGLSRVAPVARHRLVYAAVGDICNRYPIALAIDASHPPSTPPPRSGDKSPTAA